MDIADRNGYGVSCHGGSDGQATASVTGNVGPVAYAWGHGPVTASVSSLEAGEYTVIATDSIGQADTLEVIITQPSAISVSLYSPSYSTYNIRCWGGADGQISTSVNGGVAPYTYLWNTNDTLPNIGGLTAGVYDVVVTGANGCSSSAQITLGQPDALSTTVVQGASIACAGGTTSVDLSVSGGTAPYIYNWSNGALTQDLSAVASGIYHVRVEDANGCVRFDSLAVSQPDQLTVSGQLHQYANGQHFSCDTCHDAQATLTVNGGVVPYTYLWSNGQNTATVIGLAQGGTYWYGMTDMNGCLKTDTFTIGFYQQTPPFDVVASFSTWPGGYNVSCSGCTDGEIKLTPVGGTPPFVYQWMHGPTTNEVNGLAAGYYEVTVSDANGSLLMRSYTLSAPQSGLSVMLSGQYSSCKMNGNINAMVNGGTPPYSYSWYGPTGPMPTEMWSMVTVWQAGLYGVWAVDANGDSAHAELTLVAEASLWAELSSPTLYGTANASCTGYDGSIIIAIHGGAPPYMIEVTGGNMATTSSPTPPVPPDPNGPSPNQGIYFSTSDTLVVVDSLAAGYYQVKVSTMGGCGGAYNSIELTWPPELSVRVQPTTLPNGHYLSCDTCADGSAQINVAGGTGPFQYAWMEMPEGEGDSDMRLEGASLFQKLKDPSTGSGQVDPFGPANPYLIGSDAQLSGLDSEKRYAAFAMDGLGCMGGETFILEKPKGGTIATDSLRARHIRVERISSYTEGDSLLFFGDSSIIFNHQQHHIFAYTGYRGPVVGSAGTPKDLQIQCQPAVLVAGATASTNHTLLNRFMGNVGIGTGTGAPLARLDVRGQTYTQTLSVNTYDTPAKLTVQATATQGALEVQDADGDPTIRVFNDGKVVIGKGAYANTGETPIFLIQNENQQILKVNHDGIVWAREIKLSLDAFPDHVFRDDYELMSIEELERFIAREGHLPNVPSEQAVVSDGLKVSQLLTAQMEKIEELTLYIIQLNERIKELESILDVAK